jgi:hypothetical protein
VRRRRLHGQALAKELQVPTSAIPFALLSGVSAATWAVCLRVGSTRINAALGAMVISAVAFLVNALAMVTMKVHGHEIVLRWEAFWVLAFAGIAALHAPLTGVRVLAIVLIAAGIFLP